MSYIKEYPNGRIAIILIPSLEEISLNKECLNKLFRAHLEQQLMILESEKIN